MMAEVINTAINGTHAYQVDADREILKKVWEEAIADLAYMRDVINGSDSSDYILHDGAGRGARIGQPMVNQFWRSNGVNDEYAFQADIIGYYLGMWVFKSGNGEGSATMRVKVGGSGFACEAVVFNSSFTEQSRSSLVEVSPGIWEAALTLTANAKQIVAIETVSDDQKTGTDSNGDTMDLTPIFYLHSVCITPGRVAVSGGLVAGDLTYRTNDEDGSGDKPFQITTSAVSSATVLDATVIDADRIKDDFAVDAVTAADLAATQNGLVEMLTGMPCGYNASHTLIDSSTRKAFYQNTGDNSGQNNGRRMSLPLYSEAFGNIKNDATVLAGQGAAVDPLYTMPALDVDTAAAVSYSPVSIAPVHFPVIESDPGGAHVALEGGVIVALKTTPSATVTITAKITTTAGNATGSVGCNAQGFFFIDVSGIPYDEETLDFAQLEIQLDSDNKGSGDSVIVGWGFWIDD